ncbi:MAG: ankyrin repeat domain-containing protein [Bacteroidota bacterium]|nr:ankyrin repeat domain-containing protein [Bacteroidota bacterium]
MRGISFIFLFIIFSLNATGQDDRAIIDTSDYLPYPEGLNINLMIASAEGYPSEVHRLIKLGANVDATDYQNITPLIYAVANNNITTVKALLEYNPDTEIMTKSGESALHIAAKDNRLEIAEALIRAEADINIKDPHGATPLHYASAYGYFYLCDLLLYYNANIEARANDGSTPLIAAVYSGQADVSDLLLQSGSNANAPDNEGFTPLTIAAQNNDTLMMSLLLKAGAYLYATNDYKYDALEMAIRNNNTEAYKFLKARIEPEIYRSNEILSPVLIARKYGRTKILKELNDEGFPEPARLSFDHVKIQAGIKTAIRDYYTRIGLSFKDPLLKLMLNAGFELKPRYSKVLVEDSYDTYYQYYDKRYIIYAGVGKEFTLREDYYSGSLSIDLNLNAGYMMASQYRGTNIKPPDKLRIMPQVVLRWNKGKFNIYAGYEYMNTELYRIGPSWFSFGLSYDVYFDKMRSPTKDIKWY